MDHDGKMTILSYLLFFCQLFSVLELSIRQESNPYTDTTKWAIADSCDSPFSFYHFMNNFFKLKS